MNDKWKKITEDLDFAFQPVVSVVTGKLAGVEALLRNYEKYYSTIHGLFDAAFEEKMLYPLELFLRERAIEKFSQINAGNDIKLFFNIDNRVMMMPDYEPGKTLLLLEKFGITPVSVCFEISEKHEIINPGIHSVLQNYHEQGYSIAIDDFGAGYSGVNQMYYAEPDYLKIDRFLVQGIHTDRRKKLIVSNVVNLAHTLGIQVIAEGIECSEELCVCREIGCEFVQGYYIQYPQSDVRNLSLQNQTVITFVSEKRKYEGSDRPLILQQIEQIVPANIETDSVEEILEYFQKNDSLNFIPLVNAHYEPVGILKESVIKKYLYSPYGRDLLRNRCFSGHLTDFSEKSPVCDIGMSIEKVIEIFSLDPNNFGIMITEGGRYRGFLSAHALIAIINEKNISYARNQNPLSRLPGNMAINQQLASLEGSGVICYFDFDNFKPFNDKFGFRIGDRAILMFADILSRFASSCDAFAGHIGGDDFILIRNEVRDISKFRSLVDQYVIRSFCSSAETLYDDESRSRRYILAQSRSGEMTKYDLLTVSCVIVNLTESEKNPDSLSLRIAQFKKEAKWSAEKIVVTSI